MKPVAGNTGSEAPQIAIVPEMSPAEHIAKLVGENAKLQAAFSDSQKLGLELNEKLATLTTEHAEAIRQLDGAKAANLRLGVELQDTQIHLTGARAEIENLTKTVAEKETDIKLCHAELEDQHRLLTDAQKERDEYAALWEEIEKQPFIATMLQVDRQTGVLREDLTDAFFAVMDGVNQTGKAGSITLKLLLKSSEEHVGATIAMADVKKTVPKEKPDKAFFFMDNGIITEDDPKQKRLPLVGDKSMKPKAKAAPAPAKMTATVELDSALEPVYEEAAKIAATEAVSVPILQRRLSIGYTKAVVIFAALKARGALNVEAV